MISWLLIDGHLSASLHFDALNFDIKHNDTLFKNYHNKSHVRLFMLMPLIFYSAAAIISTYALINYTVNNRLDPIRSHIESIGQAGAIYYDSYYNLFVSAIAHLKGFSEELVSDKYSHLPAIYLSNGKEINGQDFLYITNKYTPVSPDQFLDAAKEIGCNTSKVSAVEVQSNPTIVDPAIHKLDHEHGSNLLQIYISKCR